MLLVDTSGLIRKCRLQQYCYDVYMYTVGLSNQVSFSRAVPLAVIGDRMP